MCKMHTHILYRLIGVRTVLLNWNIWRRELSWLCFWRKRERQSAWYLAGRLFQMCGLKVRKPWVLQLKCMCLMKTVESRKECKGAVAQKKLSSTAFSQQHSFPDKNQHKFSFILVMRLTIPCISWHLHALSTRMLIYCSLSKTHSATQSCHSLSCSISFGDSLNLLTFSCISYHDCEKFYSPFLFYVVSLGDCLNHSNFSCISFDDCKNL